MNISIKKIRTVIEELRVEQKELKQQITAYETVMQKCMQAESGAYSHLPYKKVLDELNDEYKSMKTYIQKLEQITDCYEKTEYKIVNSSLEQSNRNFDIKKANFEWIRSILDDYRIKFI